MRAGVVFALCGLTHLLSLTTMFLAWWSFAAVVLLVNAVAAWALRQALYRRRLEFYRHSMLYLASMERLSKRGVL